MRVSTFLNKSYFALLFISLNACIPEEEAVAPFDRGEMLTEALDMGTRFSLMTYYSLSEQKIVASCDLDAFDMYFSDTLLLLNPARMMRAAVVSETDWKAVKDTNGLAFIYDHSDGKSAFAIKGSGQIHVIDMGLAWDGSHLGFLKFSYVREESGYRINFGALDEHAFETNSVTFGSYFSLQRNETYELPAPHEYDLLFSRYTHYFEEEQVPYLVAGVLTSSACLSLEINDKDFTSISYEDYVAMGESMESTSDIIGYDWKEYDFDAAFYNIIDKRSYLIKDSKGFVYKLRFTSYYNQEGASGHPSFEYLML